MIIDLILDRQDNANYQPELFYREVLEYENIFDLGNDISLAMDYGTESDIKRALCSYIDNQHYSPEIKVFINSVKWLEPSA